MKPLAKNRLEFQNENGHRQTTNNSGGGGNNTGIVPVNYVTLRDIGNAGDGRDLQVSFSKSSTEALISHYRDDCKAVQDVKPIRGTARVLGAYTTVYPSGSDPTLTLTSGSRDVDNDLIRDNQAYKAYVLAVSKTGGTYAFLGFAVVDADQHQFSKWSNQRESKR